MSGLLGGQVSQAQQEVAQAADASADVQSGAVAYRPGDYPGLRPLLPSTVSPFEFHQFVGATGSQLTYVVPSKQYLQVPPVALAADTGLGFTFTNATANYVFTLGATVISPAGSAHAFGDLPPFRTRLLAFGAFPVEATVHLAELRDTDDLPIPLTVRQKQQIGTVTTTDDASLTGELSVRVSDVTVAGVPVEVGDGCAAQSPATLNLTGKGGNPASPDYYVVAAGGKLSGTISIPSFSGCTGSSGDLSRLVSAAVSAPNQPLVIQQSSSGYCFPEVEKNDCPKPDPIPYPTTQTFPY